MVSLDDCRADADHWSDDVCEPARTTDRDLGADRLRRHGFVYNCLDRADPRSAEAGAAAAAQAGEGVADCAGHFCDCIRCARGGLPQGEVLLVSVSTRTPIPIHRDPYPWRYFARAPLRMGASRQGRRAAGVRFLSGTIRFGEERDWMRNAHGQLLLAEAIHDLEEAAGIAGRDDLGTRGLDMLNYAFEKVARHFGLDQVIDARAAAAPRAFGEFNEFEIRNCAKQRARLRGDLLAVAKVTRLVIRDYLRRAARGFRNADFCEPLVNVLHL